MTHYFMNKFFALLLVLFSALFFTGCAGISLGKISEEDQNGIKIVKCLEAKGASMYGSYTCSHCKKQKLSFGESASPFIPYHECNPQGKNPEAQECINLKIEAFPTWIFTDGTRMVGYQAPEILREKTGCTDEEITKY